MAKYLKHVHNLLFLHFFLMKKTSCHPALHPVKVVNLKTLNKKVPTRRATPKQESEKTQRGLTRIKLITRDENLAGRSITSMTLLIS